jgi:hypothetical protein
MVRTRTHFRALEEEVLQLLGFELTCRRRTVSVRLSHTKHLVTNTQEFTVIYHAVSRRLSHLLYFFIFRCVRKIAKSGYQLRHVCLSVCMEQIGSH